MSGLEKFFQTDSTSTIIYGQISGVGNYALGGRFRNLSSHTCLWYNGSTYTWGYESNLYNNKVHILKQTGLTVTSNAVNNGTSSPEPLNHPAPFGYISSGDLYTIQNQFHVDAFDVWKSDNPEDITAWTQVSGAFDANGSYLALVSASGTDLVLTTRSGDSPNGYDFNILQVDLTDLNSYSDQMVVEMDFATNDVRAYLIPCNYYGSITNRVIGISSRDESSLTYYKASLLSTSDYETFSNDSFSKDVTGTPITYAELETYCKYVGTDSAKTTSVYPNMLMQVGDDDVYLTYQKNSTTMTIDKIDRSTMSQVATIDLPYTYTLSDDQDGITYLYWNGYNLVITTKVEDGVCYLGSITSDLSTYVEQLQLDVQDGSYVALPQNFDEVDGLYMISGRCLLGNGGTVPYMITDNKWII